MSDLNTLNATFRCPTCQSPDFIIGPIGGLADNIKCAGCGAKFWFSPPFEPCAIHNSDEFYTKSPVELRAWYGRGKRW